MKSYTLWINRIYDKSDSTYEYTEWFAQKGNKTFQGENPVELLGLASIHEYVNPSPDNTESYWWVVEGPDIWAELRKADKST